MAERIDSGAKAFGQKLKSIRENAGITQQEMADATGFAKNHISAIERGAHKCNAATFIVYARKCGASLDKVAGLGSEDDIIPELKEQLSAMDKDQQKKVSELLRLIASM